MVPTQKNKLLVESTPVKAQALDLLDKDLGQLFKIHSRK